MVSIPNVLADRYASSAMVALFDPVNRVRTEREFWIAVLRAQTELGVPLEAGILEDYEAVLEDIDLEAIRRREMETRHDVKARLDEFCALAGHEHLHKGLTSRDATENVEQLLSWRALELIEGRAIALLARIAELATLYADVVVVGRTHNVAAQPTTIGKRFAQFGEELLLAVEGLSDFRARYPLRGLKGPVGSQQDLVFLLGDGDKVHELEQRVATKLGFARVMTALGQVYPRSLDFSMVSVLAQLAAGPANLALMIRLMAGHDLVTEGFRPGQVGSSAMPHKMNTRSCERISGLAIILKGHVAMSAGLSGEQWLEGDVSCSVVRRVVIPDAFFALDGVFETTFAVLDGFGVFPRVVAEELDRYLPFLATTTLLMHAVAAGLGREVAHEIVKEHAVQTALLMREGSANGQALLRRLAEDERFPGTLPELEALISDPTALLGTVGDQIMSFRRSVEGLVASNPTASTYRGGEIL